MADTRKLEKGHEKASFRLAARGRPSKIFGLAINHVQSPCRISRPRYPATTHAKAEASMFIVNRYSPLRFGRRIIAMIRFTYVLISTYFDGYMPFCHGYGGALR